MFYGMCRLSVVPMRSEPSDKSELTSQLLFGEGYEIVEHREKWLHIRTAEDQYTGWIDAKQHHEVSEDFFQSYLSVKHPRVTDAVAEIKGDNGSVIVPAGAQLPFLKQGTFRIGEERFRFIGSFSGEEPVIEAGKITETAFTFLNAPYLWGGRTAFGIDCSGFVQQVYNLCGHRLMRDAYLQVEHGQDVHFVTLAKPGDLAFFDNADGRIVHVGIVLPNNQIIHAHGHVRVDQLDHSGIYNADRQAYSHKLRLIRRILPDPVN